MKQQNNKILDNVLRIHTPETLEFPVVVDSPHSGTHYPKDFHYECSLNDLRQGEDAFVAQLFSDVPAHGVYLLEALFSRSYIDLNRSENDIDPVIVQDDWDGPLSKSERANYGMGVIQRKIRPNLSIFTGTLSSQDINNRINNYYRPYHNYLKSITDEVHKRFQKVLLINAHSTPSTMLDGKKHSDITIGDRKGQTCAKHIRQAVREYFEDQGLTVSVNDPYQGVEIVKRYGEPLKQRHAVQIEINKALYMNESSFEKKDNFRAIQDMMLGCVTTLGEYLNE